MSIALDAEPPAIVECARFGPIVVHEEGGERELAHDAAGDIALPDAAVHAPGAAV